MIRYTIGLLALALSACSLVDAAECSFTAGIISASEVQAQSASVGCNVRSYDLRLHYVGEVQAMRVPDGFTELTRVHADDYLALSAMRYWRITAGAFDPQIGVGLFLKADDRADTWSWCDDEQRCARANPWVPSPVSIIGAIRVRRDDWSLSFGHISNGGSNRYNWGLEFLQLERFW